MKKYAKYMPMSGFPAKKGNALQISISQLKDSDVVRLFVEMAPQTKDKPPSGSSESPFDWGLKCFIALKEEEVGRMLACFRGRVPDVSIIHKHPIDAPEDKQKVSKLNLKSGEYQGERNWQINLRQKSGLNEEVSFNMYLQPEDTELLIVILEECVRRMYQL